MLRSGPFLVWLSVVLAAGWWSGCAPEPRANSEVARQAATVAVAEAGDAWWQLLLGEEVWLQQLVDAEVRMPDLSAEHAAELASRGRALLDRLAAVDASALTHEDWLSLEILRWDVERYAEWQEMAYRRPQFTPYRFSGNGIHGVFQQLEIEDAADAEHYLQLTSNYAGVVRDLHDVARAQVVNGWVVAAPAIDQLVGMWTTWAEAPQSVFSVCERQQVAEPADFCDRLDAVVAGEVVPALQDFVAYLDGAYREAAPADVGLGQYPGGDGIYRSLIRYFVTYDADPAQVHERGLLWLEENRAQMAVLREQLDLPADAAAAHEQLKRDPRVLAKTPEEVGERLMAYIERLKPRVGEAFELMPKAPYGVQRLDPTLEGAKTFGYYNPPTPQEERGLYYFNGSNLEDRSLLTAGSLIYHELIPGHHFQVALQSENEALPRWRQEATFHSGFTEGWAEYASSLVAEMGMYETALDQYGRLASECFLANRLIVDTGMNAMGWTLEQARQASRDNTLMSEREIQSETLRYSTDLQAQALSYGLGAYKIRELREHAKAELGDAFDLRAFHTAVLENGSMPLSVLEKHVEWWIGQQR